MRTVALLSSWLSKSMYDIVSAMYASRPTDTKMAMRIARRRKSVSAISRLIAAAYSNVSSAKELYVPRRTVLVHCKLRLVEHLHKLVHPVLVPDAAVVEAQHR